MQLSNSDIEKHEEQREAVVTNLEPTEAEKMGSTPFVAGIYNQQEYAYVIVVGVCLAFNAGYLNGSCLSGFLTDGGRTESVAGFTGAYTNSALMLAAGSFGDFGFKLEMICSFIAGSLIAGYMTPNPTAFRLEPSYGPTFFVGGIFVLIATILKVQDDNYYFFFFVAAANGIQNGISSSYSSNLIRSTHFTGTSTDIGLFIGQLLRGNDKNMWKLVVLISLTIAFWMGGLVSYWATQDFTLYSLVFNASFYFAIGITFIVFLKLKLQVTVGAAMLGTWSWKSTLEKLQASFSVDSVNGFDMDDLFDIIDADGTGTIDRDELMNVLQKLGISSTTTDILMKHADTDRDGTISRKEFQSVCKNIKA
mmetsp:Transcript_11369/g.19072  ORF Transcript_11369/g.19072 Transcript_11369/m.19072 type:complete len:364 (+) Transcript_11369:80-1171(+)